MTLQEVLSAKRDKIIKDAFVFMNQKYKVSIIYGSKLILAPEDLYNQIKLYMEHLRPKLIDDKHRLNRERYLCVIKTRFIRLEGCPSPAWCLTATCERSGVFENVADSITKRMSTSRIRFSVITELVCLGEDSLDNIAYSFGKHTKEVCKKFYVQFWSNREAARLSWKVHQMVNTENEGKAINRKEKKLDQKKIRQVKDTEQWITNRINTLKLAGTDVDDPGLMDLVRKFKDELKFHKING